MAVITVTSLTPVSKQMTFTFKKSYNKNYNTATRLPCGPPPRAFSNNKSKGLLTQDFCRKNHIKFINNFVPGDMFIPVFFKSQTLHSLEPRATRHQRYPVEHIPVHDPYTTPPAARTVYWQIHRLTVPSPLLHAVPHVQTSIDLGDPRFFLCPWTVLSRISLEPQCRPRSGKPAIDADAESYVNGFSDYAHLIDPIGTIHKVYQFSVNKSWTLELPENLESGDIIRTVHHLSLIKVS